MGRKLESTQAITPVVIPINKVPKENTNGQPCKFSIQGHPSPQ